MVYANPTGVTPPTTASSPIYFSQSQTSLSLPPVDSYNTIPFDSVDPEVYKTRNDRSIAKLGHPEKWLGYARAYWCITCNYCHKEVRFCCMCQGELKPVDKDTNDGIRRLQCTECHRVVAMRYCSACGHQFEKTVVDARMEIPGINVLHKSGRLCVGGGEGVLWRVVRDLALQHDVALLRARAQQLPLRVQHARRREPLQRVLPGEGGGAQVGVRCVA